MIVVISEFLLNFLFVMRNFLNLQKTVGRIRSDSQQILCSHLVYSYIVL